jgi:hypothetical protein
VSIASPNRKAAGPVVGPSTGTAARAARLVLLGVATATACGLGCSALETRVCHGTDCAERPHTHIYRSVGSGSTSPVATGTGNPLRVTGDVAGFANPLPDRVGVGDVLLYSSDGTAVDRVAFIAGRSSAASYTVQAADGSRPTATTSADTSWSILRAYTSLAAALEQNENPGLPAHLADFDSFSPGPDLAAADVIWNIACYGDAPDNADVSTPTIMDWATGPENYLRIYTPTLPAEVGVSQRHAGVWDAAKYHLVKTQNGADHLFNIWSDFVRVEGLQLWDDSPDLSSVALAIELSDVGETRVSDSIIRGNPANAQDGMGLIVSGGSNVVVKLWNNVVYGFTSRCLFDNTSSLPSFTLYAYGNTIVDCPTGVEAVSATVMLKNNVLQGIPAGGTCIAVAGGQTLGPSDHNVCNLDEPMTGAGSVANASVAFAAPASGDFGLAPGDVVARGRGADLSHDPDLPFATNIAGQPRATPWNIGAF